VKKKQPDCESKNPSVACVSSTGEILPIVSEFFICTLYNLLSSSDDCSDNALTKIELESSVHEEIVEIPALDSV